MMMIRTPDLAPAMPAPARDSRALAWALAHGLDNPATLAAAGDPDLTVAE